MGKTLIAYFSASGTTARAAKELAQAAALTFMRLSPQCRIQRTT